MADAMKKFEEKEKYTYGDYISWPDEIRCEIINGEIWDMSAAPRRIHQELHTQLLGNLYNFLADKPCRLYSAPFDVRLSGSDEISDEDIETVVQPDILVDCDESKLDDQGCRGAPDLIIEILSPSTSWKDETVKLALYEQHGVREYWIINPETREVRIYVLKKKAFENADFLLKTGFIKSQVLDGFEIPMEELYPS